MNDETDFNILIDVVLTLKYLSLRRMQVITEDTDSCYTLLAESTFIATNMFDANEVVNATVVAFRLPLHSPVGATRFHELSENGEASSLSVYLNSEYMEMDVFVESKSDLMNWMNAVQCFNRPCGEPHTSSSHSRAKPICAARPHAISATL